MREWLEGLAGPEYAMALLWTLAALVLLVILLVAIRIIRSLTFGTFVAGGRNRKTRLAVMDATAVDSHRRLVLVRRDDVEHLLLIGGPTDVVVEQDIRLLAQPRRPGAGAETGQELATPRPRPAEMQPPAPARGEPPRPAPRAPAPERTAPQLVRPPAEVAPARPAPQPEIPRAAPPRMPPAPPVPAPPYLGSRAVPVAPPAPAPRDDLDDALLEELQVSLDDDPAKQPGVVKKSELSLEDEMTKLLGELSNHKR